MIKIKRALVSVTDKTGVVDFCQKLSQLGIEILSTGGTFRLLKENKIPVTSVEDFTGFPEILSGRVKTLHPKIQGGILAVQDQEDHQKEMKQNGILPIDLVVVNLYDFAKVVATGKTDRAEVVGQIDIGGPTMLRAAAKNHAFVSCVIDPNDYAQVIERIQTNGGLTLDERFELAVKVFKATFQYDQMIASYLDTLKTSNSEQKNIFADQMNLGLNKKQDLRYGENPHQKAACYFEDNNPPKGILASEKLWGKELSFNNYIDLDAAYQMAKSFEKTAAVIVKHTNPCGVALDNDVCKAFLKAKQADPISCFGGIIAVNTAVNDKLASEIAKDFYECVIAPDFTDEAYQILTKKKNIRLLKASFSADSNSNTQFDVKRISGGFLIQENDSGSAFEKATIPTKAKPTDEQNQELLFGWQVSRFVKSNAIVITNHNQTFGIGAGQMSRVDAVELAIQKSQSELTGATLASDAFFPFRDSIDRAAKVGIRAIVQPGGSLRDAEVIEACDEHGIAMVFTGFRHFRH